VIDFVLDMNKLDPKSCDDENGNCRICGHPFAPHLVIAFDKDDLTKGGEVRCPVANCGCLRPLSFDLNDENWTKKLNSLLKHPS
jgi:hypothetical protein